METNEEGTTKRQSRCRGSLSAPLSYLALKRLYPSGPTALTHLTMDEKQMYAKVLFKPASLTNEAEHRKFVKASVGRLPRYLQNPSPLPHLPQSYLVEAFHRAGVSRSDLPSAARLCGLHRNLNGQIVASVLTAVQMHIEDFLPDLLETGSRSSLSAEAQHLVVTAENLLAVWITQQEFSSDFKRSPVDKWTSAHFGGCDGCLLSHIGGSELEILVALRASALAAIGSRLDLAHEVSPSALEWFDCWANEYPPRQTHQIHRASSGMAEELMRLCKREELSKLKPSSPPENFRTFKPERTDTAASAREVCPTEDSSAPQPFTASTVPKRNPLRLRICPVPFVSRYDDQSLNRVRQQNPDMQIFDQYATGSVINLRQTDSASHRRGQLHQRTVSAPPLGSLPHAKPFTPRHWPQGSGKFESNGGNSRATVGPLRSSPPPLTLGCLSESSGPSSPILESSPSITLSLGTLAQAYFSPRTGTNGPTDSIKADGLSPTSPNDEEVLPGLLPTSHWPISHPPHPYSDSASSAVPSAPSSARGPTRRKISHQRGGSGESAVTFCVNPTPPLGYLGVGESSEPESSVMQGYYL